MGTITPFETPLDLPELAEGYIWRVMGPYHESVGIQIQKVDGDREMYVCGTRARRTNRRSIEKAAAKLFKNMQYTGVYGRGTL
jgi:hypothetical protein